MVGRIVSDVTLPSAARVGAFVLLWAIAAWGWLAAASLVLIVAALAAALEVVSSFLRTRPAGAIRPTLRRAAPGPQVSG